MCIQACMLCQKGIVYVQQMVCFQNDKRFSQSSVKQLTDVRYEPRLKLKSLTSCRELTDQWLVTVVYGNNLHCCLCLSTTQQAATFLPIFNIYTSQAWLCLVVEMLLFQCYLPDVLSD